MRKISILFVVAFISFSLSAQNTLKLNIEDAETQIDRNIYGHFAEHLGHCIYGGIFVGEDSEIPNTRGFRNDVVEALKEMEIPLLRWPGGCFADTYHWKDGIGPREDRPSIVNIHWGGITENNSFGTHEFLDFCEVINAEPYICLNVGSGTVQEASEWVEYVTSSNESPMTNLRKENGRDKPWNVKYWGIGNENWGCGGNMTPDYYADLYNRFASYCGGAKFKIAGGPSAADYNWMEVLMKKTTRHKHLIQGVSLHNYSFAHSWANKGDAIGFEEDEWFFNIYNAQRMKTLIEKHSAIMDKYDPKKEIGLMVDEWGNWFNVEEGTNPSFLYQQNTLRDAMTASINLNDFNNNADRVRMANIAQMVNVLQAVILTKDENIVLTPTYYIFKMYAKHQDATLIPSELETVPYKYEDKEVPAISSSASIKEGVVFITLNNANPNEDIELEIELTGKDVKTATGQIINAQNINDYNDFNEAEKVTLADFKLPKIKNGKMTISIPAHSIISIELQ